MELIKIAKQITHFTMVNEMEVVAIELEILLESNNN